MGESKKTARPASDKETREDRLKAALRENLKRRKSQKQARKNEQDEG